MREHRLWPVFVEWANRNGVDTTYDEDCEPWWNCFLAGLKSCGCSSNW